jgi:hypothetical protein
MEDEYYEPEYTVLEEELLNRIYELENKITVLEQENDILNEKLFSIAVFAEELTKIYK